MTFFVQIAIVAKSIVFVMLLKASKRKDPVMADWHVGQKIVCVDDCWEEDLVRDSDCPSVLAPDPVFGDVYTIRRIKVISDSYWWGEYVAFELEEIAATVEGGNRPLYESTGFKPVRTTDISIFTKMLKPVPKAVAV